MNSGSWTLSDGGRANAHGYNVTTGPAAIGPAGGASNAARRGSCVTRRGEPAIKRESANVRILRRAAVLVAALVVRCGSDPSPLLRRAEALTLELLGEGEDT